MFIVNEAGKVLKIRFLMVFFFDFADEKFSKKFEENNDGKDYYSCTKEEYSEVLCFCENFSKKVADTDDQSRGEKTEWECSFDKF